MNIVDNEMLWRQLGAAIDMLKDALRNYTCSWDSRRGNRRAGYPKPGKDDRR